VLGWEVRCGAVSSPRGGLNVCVVVPKPRETKSDDYSVMNAKGRTANHGPSASASYHSQIVDENDCRSETNAVFQVPAHHSSFSPFPKGPLLNLGVGTGAGAIKSA